MRKIISLSMPVVILLSLSACRTRNIGMDNRNNGINDGITNRVRNIGMQNTNNGVTNDLTNLRGTTATDNNTRANYKDGTYTGFGDGNPEGIERATVVIRNGRIANIDLATVGQQEAANNGTGTGADTGANNAAGTGIGDAGRDAINEVKTKLINAMIQNQNGNVDINSDDANMGDRINNWKLAVARALDQARR